jgi:DNA-binding transcriptional LysR family regulator
LGAAAKAKARVVRVPKPPVGQKGEAFIIYPKEKPLSPSAREFLNLLRRSRPKEKAIEKPKARLRSSKS